MKKIFALALALVFAMSSACLAQDAGVYTGTAMGMKGMLTVEVQLAGNEIVDVKVIDHVDTPVISDAAIGSVPARIVEQQNIEVDVASGATMTSFAIRNAVSAALEAAGLNPADYRKGSDAVTEKTQKAEEAYDVVIVGGGIAGMSAAVRVARESDASVLVLEKESYAGGSSRVCGGGIWALGTELNEQIGVDCTAQEMIDFFSMRGDGAQLNEALITNIHGEVADTFNYFADNGLPYAVETWSLGHPDSKLPVFWSVHNQETPWSTGYSRLYDAIEDMARELGVEIRLNSEVTSLIAEGNAVNGVQVEDLTSTYAIAAKKVILATGGFTRNAAMIEKYAPEYANAFAFTGAGSTGDGIAMTEALGAQVVGQGMMGLMGINPNLGYYEEVGNLVWMPTLTVNAEGEDIALGSLFYSETLKHLLEQTGSQGYGIFDSTTAQAESLEKGVAANMIKKFDTLDELAASFKIDAETLKATAQNKNLAEGPYYCFGIRPLFIGSIPGLKVDAECRILGENDEPIENLFGAGELIFGNVFAERYPASGTGMGVSAYSGSLAANTAVAELAEGAVTYSATVPSMKGDMTVYTTLNDTGIVSIDMDTVDTVQMVEAVKANLIPAIIEKQSIGVDSVTGATVSSAAVKSGVRSALEQAGMDVAAFSAQVKTEKTEGEQETASVVVVGSGAAGLSTAIQLKKNGVENVVLLEKLGYFGGTSGSSSGGAWVVGDTEFNKMSGFDYDADGLIKHLYEAGGAEAGTLNEGLVRNIAAVSAGVFNDYVAEGLPWDLTRYTFGDSLNEMPVAWVKTFYDTPWESGAGITMINALVETAKKYGVDLRLNAKVTSLITDENGAVTGVSVEGKDKLYTIAADKVVLATGGFQRNAELVAEIAPDYTGMVPFTGAGSTGDGITMARELGAYVVGNSIGGARSGYETGLSGTDRYAGLGSRPRRQSGGCALRFRGGALFRDSCADLRTDQRDCVRHHRQHQCFYRVL